MRQEAQAKIHFNLNLFNFANQLYFIPGPSGWLGLLVFCLKSKVFFVIQ